jgi:hypothetical protein
LQDKLVAQLAQHKTVQAAQLHYLLLVLWSLVAPGQVVKMLLLLRAVQVVQSLVLV